MRVVWINKSEWKKPGPIVYMGLLNALSFAENAVATDYFVTENVATGGRPATTDDDLRDFYGVAPNPSLHIHRVAPAGRTRGVYDAALTHIANLLEGGTPTLVCTRELGCLAALLRLKKRFARLRVLYEAHDYYLNIRHLPRRGWSARRRQLAEQLLLPRVDGLICLTEHQRALYQQSLPGQHLLALPLGSTTRTAPATHAARLARRTVAYIGHLHGYKGLEELFALAAHLGDHAVSLRCIGGNPAQITALQARAGAAGLQDTLSFTGFVSPFELHAILSSEISIGIAPLQDTFYNRYLTCPVKVLDFIGHGLPVVASDLPSTRALLGDAGSYCRAADIQAFGRRILALLDTTDRYIEAAQASAAQAVALDWRQRARRIIDHFAGDFGPRP